jgi:hypothetical protein
VAAGGTVSHKSGRILQGVTKQWTLTWWLVRDVTPMDLTGYAGEFEGRKNFNSPVSWTADVEVDGPNGVVTVILSAAITADLRLGETGIWDGRLTKADSPTLGIEPQTYEVIGAVTQ